MSRRRPARNQRATQPTSSTTRLCRCELRPPTHGARLCRECTTTLRTSLARIAEHTLDLETLRAGETRYSTSGGGRTSIGRDEPLGFNALFDTRGRGTQVEASTRATLVSWIHTAVGTWPHLDAPTPKPRRTHVDAEPVPIAVLTTWLTQHLHAIAGQPWVTTMYDEILHAESRLRSLVDRPADRLYVGTCLVCAIVGQTTPLYARVGATKVRCPALDCGHEQTLADAYARLANDLSDQLLTAADLARLAKYFGYLPDAERTRSRITTWRQRDRLKPAGTTPRGEPLYPFGPTVVALLEADAKRAAKAHRRGA